MKLPDNRTGLSTPGLAGITVMAGVIFADLNPWWLTLAIILMLSGTGIEAGKNK